MSRVTRQDFVDYIDTCGGPAYTNPEDIYAHFNNIVKRRTGIVVCEKVYAEVCIDWKYVPGSETDNDNVPITSSKDVEKVREARRVLENIGDNIKDRKSVV